MASLHKETDRGRDGYRLRFRDHENKQRSLWLGKVSRRSADTVLRHVSELVYAKKSSVRPEADSVKWAESLDGRLRDRLSDWGLVKSGDAHGKEQARHLGRFVDVYISERTDAMPSTITNFKHARRWLVEFFKESKLIEDITPADADRWQRFLNEGDKLAPSTVEKIIKRAKTMFRHAVRDRLLEESPFGELKVSCAVNRDRDFFVTPAITHRVLQRCGNSSWQSIFALARYGGLRTPSETLQVKWSDIDWKEGKFRIDSPKTGLRFCPLFDELRAVLEVAHAERGESPFVVSKYRGSEKNLRTQLIRIIEDAGLKAWPKPFVNLRATRRTELQELFPDHVVNAWLGHSSRIAEKHYLQVTPEHWSKAIGGNAGGNIRANHSGSTALCEAVNAGNLLPDGSRFPVIFDLAPPQGLEPWT